MQEVALNENLLAQEVKIQPGFLPVLGLPSTLINSLGSFIQRKLLRLLALQGSVDILTHGSLSWLMANSMPFSQSYCL